MDDRAIRAGPGIGSGYVTPIHGNPDQFVLGSLDPQHTHPDRSYLLDIDASIFQRFIDAGPLPLKERRRRQFWQRLRLAFTQQGISQIEQRIGSSLKALIDLLTNVLQSGTVHYVQVLCFCVFIAKNFTLVGSLWQARAAFFSLSLNYNPIKKMKVLLNKHILPAIGHISSKTLCTTGASILYSKAQRRIICEHGSRNACPTHKALDQAVRWKIVSVNVCDAVSQPSESKTEMQILNKEQAQKLLEAAKGHRLETLLTVALATGMRKGELLALRWEDVIFRGDEYSSETYNHWAIQRRI